MEIVENIMKKAGKVRKLNKKDLYYVNNKLAS